VIVVMVTSDDEVSVDRIRLREHGAGAAELVAPSDARKLLLTRVDDESEAAHLVARLRAAGRLAVQRPDGGPQLARWERHTRPIEVGDRLSVCLAWSEHDRRGLPNLVEIDPGGGFGTGEHPASRLLLELLTSRITGGETVLDVGCGTGLLGICAVRLGAQSAIGTDIEAEAVEATRRNAALNGVGRQVTATLVPGAEVEGVFDVVLANIGREAIVDLAEWLIARVSTRGWIAVSGISPPQSDLVASVLRPLEVVEERTLGEWSAVVLARSA
jgi:ribosomal protein L11 methyltransferase